MKPDNNINIVVASDNHYAILIAALLKSIDINHKTDEHIDFHIIDDGISAKTKAKLNTVANPERITVKWFCSKAIIPPDLDIPVDNSSFPRTAYMRVFSPYVVDPQVERLIYLDVDTIVQDDISKLWHLPLTGFTIAAAQDVGETVDCKWGGVPNYADLGLDAKTKYFNSGVLLIDAKQWRAERISYQVMDALEKYKKYVVLADQYGMNVVMANKWQQLDPKWNWFAFKENENPSIIHFLDIKPIFKSYNSQVVYRDEFYKYLALTPWKDFGPISGSHRQIRKIYNKIKKVFMK